MEGRLVVASEKRKEEWLEEVTKEHKETFGSEEYVFILMMLIVSQMYTH